MTLHQLRSLLSSSATQARSLHRDRAPLVRWAAFCPACAAWRSRPAPKRCLGSETAHLSPGRMEEEKFHHSSPPRGPSFPFPRCPGALGRPSHSPDLLFKRLCSPSAAYRTLLHSRLLPKSHVTNQTRCFSLYPCPGLFQALPETLQLHRVLSHWDRPREPCSSMWFSTLLSGF